MSPSSSDQKRAANAAAGKTARACDSCLRKRARWYCAADDAFLCQACDSSVHSANSLARRHERVRLKTASFKPTHRAEEDQSANSSMENKNSPPAWHQGFRRKARTPRHGKPSGTQQLASKLEQLPLLSHPIPALVPEIGSDETLHDENEEQLLYRVPIFDPFVAEFCKSETPSSTDHQAAVSFGNYNNFDSNSSPTTVNNNAANIGDDHESKDSDLENLHGLILPSDIELAEFAADVETLLGRGLDEDSIGMEGLGLLDANEYRFGGTGRVKIEEDEEEEQEEKVRGKNLVTYACHLDQDIDMSGETLDLKFDCETPTTGGEEEEEKVAAAGMTKMMTKIKRGSSDKEIMKRRVLLRLDYDAVIAAWASHGSPWTTGDRPEVNPDDLWANNFATWATEVHQAYGGGGGGGGELGSGGGHMGMGDGGREARVSRYREKRRTRLFSKKIRYEVRKLNAEKRPRMKGRFVKRAPYVGGGPGFPF